MDYVLVRVPPPASGLPRPRFSLYLSSQLQYGVVLVYHRQCGFLLGITASQESITLTEREPVSMPEPEFEGAELQDSNLIELLLEQPDHFPEGEEERQRKTDREGEQIEKDAEEEREPSVPDERAQERAALEREATRDLTPSDSLDLVQITGTSSQDVVLLPEEDFGLPMEMPVLEEIEKTPVSVTLPIPSPLPSEEVEMVVEPRKEKTPAVATPEFPKVERKRRRQLLFIDKDTQISQDEMRSQIDDVEIETRPLMNVLIKPPFEKSDAKALLGNPCMSLPPEILALWKQAAVVRPIPPSEFHWEVPVEEEIPEREEERHEPEEEELSSKEIPREMVESGLSQQETPASFVVLETTDKDFSPLVTPESRRSPVPEIQYSLEDIQEERIPEMEEISVDTDEPVRPLFAVEGLVTFHSLLPPQASRRIVAQIFWGLLEKTVAKQITVRQDEPYGDIIISQEQPLTV
ncbi:meiotic recombination protein REC8 homolog [Xyrauchen texanus]|uniref:meiotic recombination protein REC8 homolog n=1 Tax=Xyrauchen texanus TaxID=154827 RepID=UPI0022418E96|nr:meiotic recombination protein REC8 homolog [Xyrauchen texanus]